MKSPVKRCGRFSMIRRAMRLSSSAKMAYITRAIWCLRRPMTALSLIKSPPVQSARNAGVRLLMMARITSVRTMANISYAGRNGRTDPA